MNRRGSQGFNGRFNTNGQTAISRFLSTPQKRHQILVYNVRRTIKVGVRLDRFGRGVVIRFVFFVNGRQFQFQTKYTYLPTSRDLQQYIVTTIAKRTTRRIQDVQLARNHVPSPPIEPLRPTTPPRMPRR